MMTNERGIKRNSRFAFSFVIPCSVSPFISPWFSLRYDINRRPTSCIYECTASEANLTVLLRSLLLIKSMSIMHNDVLPELHLS